MSAQVAAVASLAYDAQTQSVVSILPSKQALRSAVAELWFKVSDDGDRKQGATVSHVNVLSKELTSVRS